MKDIKLFVCCHQQLSVSPHPLLVPVQVGAALAPARFPGFRCDDDGVNISAKNRFYCELTAQYWAWKNVKADYYGFFHYRRCLYPDLKEKLPYRFRCDLSGPWPEKLGYDHFGELIEQYDLILPIPEDMHVDVRSHYESAPYHRGEDLTLAEELLHGFYPSYTEAAEQYLSGTKQYFGNIFIMRRELFFEYCRYLFPLLEAFDRSARFDGRNAQEMRVDGYLAERLLGVFALQKQAELKLLELPRAVFVPPKKYLSSLALNTLLPPGSRRRAAVKGLRAGR